MKITEQRIFLQYGKEGERGEYHPVGKSESEKFVALDDASGGYPYAVEINKAHDFKTVEAAGAFDAHFNAFHMRRVTVTYEF